MRWVVRFGIVFICFLLLIGVLHTAPHINATTSENLIRKPFPFPAMLPDSPIYIWGITRSEGRETASLLLQNTGSTLLKNIHIEFMADGEILHFSFDDLLPGCKVYVEEEFGAKFADWSSVAYISYTAKIQNSNSFLCEEDYSCKK